MATRPGLRPFWRIWFSLWGVGLALWLTITHWTLWLNIGRMLFGAFLISLAIHPLAEALRRWHIPRGLTVLLVYVSLTGLIVLIGALLIPVISAEVESLRNDGPGLIQDTISRLGGNRVLGKWLPSVDTVSTDLTQRLDAFVHTFVKTVTQVGGFALELFITLILSYFFVTDVALFERLLNAWVPAKHRPRLRHVVTDINCRLTRWVWAQLGIALYFAVVFSIGLAVLGVPFALSIGIVGGFLEIVPYLGGIVAWLLAIFSAVSVSPLSLLWVTLFYVAVVEIETHIVAPALYGRVTGIHPALVLIALVIGAKTGGIIGVLFAVPVTVVLVIILEELRVTFIVAQDETPV
jgi:predicted PurR-regulated permease PerM